MISLIYPAETAPVMGALAGASEMLPVVDEGGLITAQASREECHSGNHLMHPVVHMHIINRMGQIYLQHRGPGKKQFPNMWDTAVGGHVSYGESFEESLFREASEELGFKDFNPIPVISYVNSYEVENELVAVFAAVGSFDLHPNNFEVSEGRWWNIDEIRRSCGKGIFTDNFEHEFKMLKDKLLALL